MLCSWLRSSTAPSESTPASMSGASASTKPPAVFLTSSSTSLSPKVVAGDDDDDDDDLTQRLDPVVGSFARPRR